MLLGELVIMESSSRNSSVFLSSTLLALAGVSIFFSIALQNVFQNYINQIFGQANLIIYIFALLLYIIIFWVAYRLFSFKKSWPSYTGKRALAIFISALAVISFLLYLQYINELDVFASGASGYIWHQIPLVLFLITIIALYCAFTLLTRWFNASHSQTSKGSAAGFWLISIIIALIAGYSLYYPNPFPSPGGLYHFHAYYNSVYNVLHGIPYSEAVGSIYGHYAIFLAPFLNLAQTIGFSNLLNIFAYLIAAITVLSFLFAAYAVDVFVENKIIKIITVIAMALPIISLRDSAYIQLHPHRTIILCAFLAMIAYAYKHRNRIKKIAIIGYIVGILFVVWSTETGIMAMAAWTIFFFILELQQFKANCLRCWLKLLLYGAGFLLSIIAAIGIVNIYNLAAGGSVLSLPTFFFPLFQNSYMVGVLQAPLPIAFNAWLFVLAIFLVFLGKGLSTTKLLKKDTVTDLKSAGMPSIAFLGICAVTYFINRPAYHNLDITHIIVMLLMAVAAQSCFVSVYLLFHNKIFREISIGAAIKAAVGIITVFVIFVLALGCLVNSASVLSTREKYKDKSSLQDITSQIASTVSEDTLAFGLGVPELYSIMGWDTHAYLMDFADITTSPQFVEHLRGVIRDSNRNPQPVLTTASTLVQIQKLISDEYEVFVQTYNLAASWEFCTESFQYYVPKL